MIERLVALAVLAASGVYLANALPLPQGTAARPGAGFFPLAVGVFGTAVALVWAVSALRRAPAPATGRTATAAENRGRVATTAALLIGFCLLLPWTGYPLVAFLFTGLALHGLGARWAPALVIALASAVASYYLFAVLLGVPLPGGALFD
jgi:putative tricarboxylic transport membrane protein